MGNNVRLSVGTALAVSTALPAAYSIAGFGALTYTDVGEVTGLGEFGGTATMVNHVPLKDGVIAKRKGSRDYGGLSIQMGKDVADAGQLILKAGFDGAASYAAHSFRITTPDQTLYFTGMVASFTQVKNDANTVSGIGCVVELDAELLESALYPIPDFLAALSSTLTLSAGTGTYTFARAGLGTVLDQEGVVRSCIAGEARFRKARRIENLLHVAGADSANINDAVWAGWVGTETIHSTTEYTEAVGGGLQTGIYSGATTIPGEIAGRIYRVSFYAYLVSGGSNTNSNIRLRLEGSAGNYAGAAGDITLTGVLTRHSDLVTVTSNGTGFDLHFRSGGNQDDADPRRIHIEQIQIEDVTNQADTSAGTYVSCGMGDDHGSGVDGVAYFDTGASQGYIALQDKANELLHSADLTNAAWAKTNVTASANAKLAGISACDLIATGVTSVEHYISQSITTITGNEDIVVSCFAAAGAVDQVFLAATRSGDTATQFFNLTTGAIGTTSNGADVLVNNSHIEPVKGGYLISAVFDGHSTAGIHTMQFGVASTDGVRAYAAADAVTAQCRMTGMVGATDHERGEYIPTTTAPVTYTGSDLSYDVANVTAAEFSVVVEFDMTLEVSGGNASNSYLFSWTNLAGFNPGAYIETRSNGTARISFYDSTGAVVYRATFPAITTGKHKIGIVYSKTAGQRLAVYDGTAYAATTDVDDLTSWTADDLSIAGWSGAGQPDFPVVQAQLWNSVLTQAQLELLTQ